MPGNRWRTAMTPVRITTLPPDRWEAFRTIRLASLAAEPRFAKHHREEAKLDEIFWRAKVRYGIFALDGDAPVGLVLYTTTDQKETAKIYGLHVERGWRRQGIAGRLFARIIELVREKENVARIALSVDSELSHAVRLYRRHGFSEAGEVRDGELPMEKRL